MSVQFIIKYQAVELSRQPIGGKDKKLVMKDTPEEAIAFVKANYPNNRNIAIFANYYTSEANLKRDFTYQNHLVWASYL